MARRLWPKEAARLHVKLAHRRIAMAAPCVFADPALLGQIAYVVPFADAVDIDGLQRAPEPDDVKIVKALLVDVIALGLHRGAALAGRKIQHFVIHGKA